MSGLAVLNGMGTLGVAPWLGIRGLWVGAVLAAIAGGAIVYVFGRELGRLLLIVRSRESVGRARRERMAAFEARFSGLPPGERGPALADEIESILGGKS